MNLRQLAKGKVRDIYELDEKHLLLVTSDRLSIYDVVLAQPIPDRGRVLTALTEFWLSEVAGDLPSHLVGTEASEIGAGIDDALGRSMVVRRAEMVPVEFIVRAYLAGSGWREYRRTGTLHGRPMPAGLKLGSRLPEPILTPSTKAPVGEHDRNLSWAEAVNEVGDDVMTRASEVVLKMFGRGASHAAAAGFILADTKFEIGWIDGELSICDEVLTPDSSRYWPSVNWLPGEEPQSFDKQYVRDWADSTGWNHSPPPPPLTGDVITQTRALYVEAYERLTSKTFANWPGVSQSPSIATDG